LRIKRDILNLSDDTVVTTLVNIGHGHYKMNDLTQALRVYKEALTMKELGQMGPGVGRRKSNSAKVHPTLHTSAAEVSLITL
jgi:hypothetical protein